MKLTAFRIVNSAIEVTWANGNQDVFHLIWLRDNVLSSDNFDPVSGERRLDMHLLPADPQPSHVKIGAAGGLVVQWADLEHETIYPADWLFDHAYSEAARARRSRIIPSAKPWDFASKSNAPVFDYNEVLESPAAELEFLKAFRTYGLAFIEAAPTSPGVVESLTQRLGYTREVAFGLVRDIKSAPAYENVAFTTHRVSPHIDGVNYAWPYDVQFLHCIVNSSQGGNSWVVDGYAVVERFRRQHPSAFETLTRVPVDYKIGAGSSDICLAAPVLALDRDGAVQVVRFSNQQRRILSVPHEDVEAFYRAYRMLSAEINDPSNHLEFRFDPGDILMFNNHRVLHARDKFDPGTGSRHLQLATTDIEMVDSRIRILTAGQGPNRTLAA